MSVGGWALCEYTGLWRTDGETGFEDFPIRRTAGTPDMQEYWNPDRRGIAVSHPGFYQVDWAFRVISPNSGHYQFSVSIGPWTTAVGVYGATQVYHAGTSYLHTGCKTVKCTDLSDVDTGVVRPLVDGYSQRMQIQDAQMRVQWIGGL